ncbi:MAG: 1-acyl-sn-glycerol-3-phosphate acyltransferase [Merismopedia sp. SIO2A8]|nr:1-acyl-sn-glycerol-3-phosphate acyltransferase [Merismopedia sp. SIO2A8]
MNPRQSVQPPLAFIPPRFNPWVSRFSYMALPLLLTLRLRPWLPAGIQRVEVNRAKTLVNLFHQFQTGKIRLLIAFRHVEVDDPLCMGYMFSRTVPRVARKQHIPLKHPIHSHFMYDRGMSLWAGTWLKGFFACLGGISVRRGRRMDLTAIKTARDILINGQFPLTIAPEGATNGHSDILSPLEPGVAQMAFWGVQDLKHQARSETMIVLPVSIRYHYPQPDWSQLDRLMERLEVDCGLTPYPLPPSPQLNSDVSYLAACYQRLVRIGTQMLSITEQVYRNFYHAPLDKLVQADSQLAEGIELPEDDRLASDNERTINNEAIAHHLPSLLDEMLKIGERYFGLPSGGELPTRCRRLEEAGWNRIYREDIADIEVLSPMEKGFADRIARESQWMMLHMRLVESLVAVTGHYVKETPTFERFAETTLILFDVMERIKNVTIPCRPRLGWREAHITIGNPISVTERWSSYAGNRRSGKQAIDTLTADIQRELERLMLESQALVE